MERNSRTSIVLETLRTIATILLFAPLSTATPFPNISTNFSPRNSRVYKWRIKRRRNFLFTKSKRARAVFEFSIRALAFLFLIDGTHTFSRSRGRASNDRIFLLSIFQHSSWMDRVHYLPPILPSSSHGSCHVAMHRRVRRMILLPSRDHGTSRVRRARSVRSLSLFFFPSISTPVFRRISTMVAAIRWTPRFPGCRVDKGGRKRGKNREDGIFFPFPRKVVAPWRGMRARNHHEWCWARTGASGVALASPRLGPKRNHHHPRAPPRRVHHPDRPRGGNSGGARQCTTPRLLLPPLPF